MPANSSDTLLLGVARETINPPMEGREVIYPIDSPAKGVESDLSVRVMVFGTPGSDRPQAALAVFDTLYIHPEFARDIRQLAAKQLPGLSPDSIMLSSTHTHSAPPLRDFDMTGRGWSFKLSGLDSVPHDKTDMGRGWAGRVALRKIGETGNIAPADPAYLDQVKTTAASAIARAWQSRRSVKAGIGLAEARLAHNRRVVDEKGKAANVWNDPDGQHSGFCDPNMRFVVFRDAGDNSIHAILSGYGCHPVTLGLKNAQPCPDYPGHFARQIEAATGAKLALHVTTGGGDINPRRGLGDISLTKAMADGLAKTLLASLNHTLPLPTAPIAVATVPLEFALRPIVGRGPAELIPQHPYNAGQHSLTTEVQAIRIGDLAFLSAPGELFAELVIAVENLSPLPHTIVVGHANDALGYIITEAAGREGGYEAVSGAISDNMERPFLAAARAALSQVSKVISKTG